MGRISFFKRAVLPPVKIRKEMMLWDQDGPKWKQWRIGKLKDKRYPKNRTIGASTVGTAIGVGGFNTPASVSKKMAVLDYSSDDEEDVEEKKAVAVPSEEQSILYTDTGHVMEPLCSHLAIRSIKETFGVKNIRGENMGVMYNLKEPFKSASPDLNVMGDTFTFDGEEIDLNRCYFEDKAPGKARHKEPPHGYVCQTHWQMETAQSQDPKEGPREANLATKNRVLLCVLEVPFIQDKMIKEIGKESFAMDENEPWELKIWSIPFHRPLMDWMNNRVWSFQRYHEKGECLDGFINYAWGKIPQNVMPPIKLMISKKYYHKGPKSLDLHDKEAREAYVDASSFSETKDGEYKPVDDLGRKRLFPDEEEQEN